MRHNRLLLVAAEASGNGRWLGTAVNLFHQLVVLLLLLLHQLALFHVDYPGFFNLILVDQAHQLLLLAAHTDHVANFINDHDVMHFLRGLHLVLLFLLVLSASNGDWLFCTYIGRASIVGAATTTKVARCD